MATFFGPRIIFPHTHRSDVDRVSIYGSQTERNKCLSILYSLMLCANCIMVFENQHRRGAFHCLPCRRVYTHVFHIIEFHTRSTARTYPYEHETRSRFANREHEKPQGILFKQTSGIVCEQTTNKHSRLCHEIGGSKNNNRISFPRCGAGASPCWSYF